MTKETKYHICPMDNEPLEGMGHLAPTAFKPCGKCGREWYYVGEDLMSKPRKVSIVAPIVPGAKLDDCIKPKLPEWCFTFGCDDVNSRRFVRVVAKDSSEARDIMFSVYGTKWAFQYDNDAEFAKQIERWNLTELAVLYHKQ